MGDMSLIPGEFECGRRYTFAEFMALPMGAVIWGKCDQYEGVLQIEGVDDNNFRSLTDGDCVAIAAEFPNVASDSPVAVNHPNLGQMEFFHAEAVFEGKS